MDDVVLWGFNRDAVLTALDFSTSPQRSSADASLRVKNRSMQYTAQAPELTLEGTGAEQYLLSADQRTFAASLVIADLAPSAVSVPLWIRRVTASDAELGAFTCTLRVHPAAWVNTTIAT